MANRPVSKSVRKRLCVMTDEELTCVFESLRNMEWAEDDYYNREASVTMTEWADAVLAEVTAREL